MILPLRLPRLINFFKPILFLASDSTSGFRRGISHFFTATKDTTDRVEGRTNEQYGLGSVPSARKGVLCDDFVQLFVHFVDYRGRVFFAKLLQKPLGMLTHLLLSSLSASFCWPFFPWTAISRRLVSSAVRCRLLSLGSFVNWTSLGSFVNCLSVFSCIFLSSSTSGLVVYLELRPLCGFRTKTDKNIVCPESTPIFTRIIKWVSRLFSYGHFYW